MAQPAQGSGIRIGRIFGIPIYLHASWFIIFVLITLSLRMQFTSQHPGWTSAQHWALGIITSAFFFASVIFHELSHSVVAKHYRIPVQSITLFVFGGLARIERDPSSAMQEFKIAIAGPLSSLFLAGCFWLVQHFVHGSDMVTAAAYWLAQINFVLAIFNLVPGFPLDGGRILRGIAWAITGDFTRASQIASTSGTLFAYFMIVTGIWQALSGNWVGGLWLAFIGWFLLEAARESIAHVVIRNTLLGVRAEDIMTPEIPTVGRDMTLEEYVHEVLRTGRRCHVVGGDDRPYGLVTLQSARAVPRDEWHSTSIQAIMVPFDRVHSAARDEPALRILERMQTEDVNQMPVVSDGRVIGMIGRDAILRVLQARLQTGRLAAS
ncbi:MAG TPA: site-2 protease family protein [Candidatus Acidoferrales bacterium]|nr:site-2 protease family protein [Candidatus Acidoferrales bacterium]